VMPLLLIFSMSIIDDSTSIVDDFRVMLQLVASLTSVINDRHIFIVQAIVPCQSNNAITALATKESLGWANM
jgi:hypothetical protein